MRDHRHGAANAPVFNSSSSLTVAENASVGTDLGSLGASDPDGGTLSYVVIGGPFTVSSSGDLITTAAALLNAETSPSYLLLIAATSPNGLTSQEQVRVNSTAVYVPVIATVPTWSVLETAPAGTNIGSVSASDPDGGSLAYSIASENGPFAIDSSGMITMDGTLDPSNPGPYSLSLDVTNPAGLFSTTTVTINPLFPPTLNALANATINENSSLTGVSLVLGNVAGMTDSLTVTASSSNTTLVPNANLAVNDTNGSWALNAVPAAGQSGDFITITVTATDALWFREPVV